MDTTFTVLAISGSLRRDSYNTALITAFQQLAPAGTKVELYQNLAFIPPYDDDVRLAGFPEPVEDLRERISAADALVFATPEYNRSFSGVLKNAIDWVSRPPNQPLNGKAAIVTGAGPGALGTALANYHLRQVLSVLGVHVLPGLEILVGNAADKFDHDKNLTHHPTIDVISESMIRLKSYCDKLNSDTA